MRYHVYTYMSNMSCAAVNNFHSLSITGGSCTAFSA